MTNSLLNKYKMQKCYVLVEKELDSIETQMAISPMRRLSCLTALFGVSKVCSEGIEASKTVPI
jgi:hypothetical protein